MPPQVNRTAKRYRDAIAYAPTPGWPSRQPPGTGRLASARFHGPIPSPYIGVGDGDGLGGLWDDIKATASGIVAPATEKLDRLEMSIKAILVLSGIAAGTGLLNLLRR